MTTTTRVTRFEVRPRRDDPVANALRTDALALGFPCEGVRTARVYFVEGDLDEKGLDRISDRLLADPVLDEAHRGASEHPGVTIEVHPLPGVMDPAAQSVRDAIRALLDLDVEVSTGWRYDFEGMDEASARALAERLLANGVIHAIHDGPFLPDALPRGHARPHARVEVPIRDLDDDALERLSRDGHLFLSLEEMHAVRDEYRRLEREPAEIELETLAQTWSEHCVHKTLKSTVRYTGEPLPDAKAHPREGFEADGDGVVIHNLLKRTVAAATFELIDEGLDWTLSVFVDNAGVIRFDDEHALCIKVETHNHPSAIEPYGGAATGIGGCLRDIIGTGLSAMPIASTDVFCVAPPDLEDVPTGCLPPKRILKQVVAGVRDYGNRMGIPTVNGCVDFDERYVGNPLVFCGSVGIMPIDRIEGEAKDGDLIVALGGRTGRDGIHGATFSSAELTDTHADEFSHAVQIGNAIEEKRVLDAILRARDEFEAPLFSAITDCGAGGFSSAVGEMGERLGAVVQLDEAPLKYEGLTPTEIWISEAQERMVLSVPPSMLEDLRRICDEEHVELAVLGTFGHPDRDLVLRYEDLEVGRMPMALLHEGIPEPTREAHWTRAAPTRTARESPALDEALRTLIADPRIASKHWIIRQYDHEVQGNLVTKPLVGRGGPGNASVLQPVATSNRGFAIGCGLATGLGDPRAGGDPYVMALAAIDECVRNLVSVGVDPARIAILDNFCWPSCRKPENLGSLVRAAVGCYDGAKAYRTPFVSGKDSLNNQFTTEEGRTIEIPPTLLITGLGIVEDVRRSITSDAKRAGNRLLLVGETQDALAGSTWWSHFGGEGLPEVDLDAMPKAARTVAALIASGIVRSCHDVSDGGALTAIAEMCIGGGLGAEVDLTAIHDDEVIAAFGESPGRYVLEVEPQHAHQIVGHRIGWIREAPVLVFGSHEVTIEDLRTRWRATLDW